MQGNPLQPLRLDFLGLNLPCVLSHNCSFSLFVTKQGERRAYPMSALGSPTFPLHIPLIHHQGKLQAAPRHSTLPCAAGGMFSLRFAKYFLHSLNLFFLCYFCNSSWLSHPLKEAMLKIDDL